MTSHAPSHGQPPYYANGFDMHFFLNVADTLDMLLPQVDEDEAQDYSHNESIRSAADMLPSAILAPQDPETTSEKVQGMTVPQDVENMDFDASLASIISKPSSDGDEGMLLAETSASSTTANDQRATARVISKRLFQPLPNPSDTTDYASSPVKATATKLSDDHEGTTVKTVKGQAAQEQQGMLWETYYDDVTCTSASSVTNTPFLCLLLLHSRGYCNDQVCSVYYS